MPQTNRGRRAASRLTGGTPAAAIISARVSLLMLTIVAALLVSGCLLGTKKKQTAPVPTSAASPAASTAAASPRALAPTPPVPAATALVPFTPPPPTSIARRTPTPQAGVREENGLRIQDVHFVGKVSTAGGLRVRSGPNTSAPVVGSVPEGGLVNVDGKVLNGAEAEQGKGTVWYIVGVKQYVYGAEGYIQPVGTPAPTPASQ